jgi:hypothetical protein
MLAKKIPIFSFHGIKDKKLWQTKKKKKLNKGVHCSAAKDHWKNKKKLSLLAARFHWLPRILCS